MALNLRVGFKEKHCKCLSKALLDALPPDKKIRPEAFRKESVSNTLTAQVPLSNVVRSGQELVMSSFVEKDVCSSENRTLAATPGGDATQ